MAQALDPFDQLSQSILTHIIGHDVLEFAKGDREHGRRKVAVRIGDHQCRVVDDRISAPKSRSHNSGAWKKISERLHKARSFLLIENDWRLTDNVYGKRPFDAMAQKQFGWPGGLCQHVFDFGVDT